MMPTGDSTAFLVIDRINRMPIVCRLLSGLHGNDTPTHIWLDEMKACLQLSIHQQFRLGNACR